jgi:hypothetical protein
MQRTVRAVQAFESLEQQDQPLDVPALQLVVLPVDRMRHRVRDALRFDVLGDVVNILRPRLQLRVLLCVDAVDEQVEFAVIFREPDRHLFADQHIVLLRRAAAQRLRSCRDP